ncbi:11965_t:CDS:2, partial [Acaulospora colombiana]
IRLEGIGISVINKRMQELLYASMRALEFKYNDSTLYNSIHFVVKWLQYFSLLLQEMTFEIDEDFLFALLEFAKIQGPSTQEENEMPLIDGTPDIPEPKSSEGDSQLYFEVLHIEGVEPDQYFLQTYSSCY